MSTRISGRAFRSSIHQQVDEKVDVVVTESEVGAPERQNIIIFGGTGAGKSSLVNQLAGEEIADTSSKALGCTMASHPYDVEIGGEKLRLFDTMGLNEAGKSIDAIVKAYQLVHRLEQSGGIQLLVFCIRAGRVTQTMQQNWHLFHDVLCEKRVPIVLVITGLEQENTMEEWWTQNKKVFKQYSINPAAHACITSIPGLEGSYQEKYDRSTKVVRELLLKHYNDLGYNMGARNWFIRVARYIQNLSSHPASKHDMRNALRKHCGIPKQDADIIVQKFNEVDYGVM